jgi:AcrR family transcriptional regulator
LGVASTPPAGLRERKKEKLREQIVQAAIELFARQGFESTTIDQIVAEVDASRRTFFRYFATKEELLTEWIEADRFRIREALASRPAGECPIEAARHVFAYVAGLLEADRSSLLAIEKISACSAAVRGKRQAKLERIARELTEVFASRMRLNAQRDLRPRLLANLVTAAVQSAFDTWLAGGGKGSLAQLMDEALRVVSAGVPATQAGGVAPTAAAAPAPRRRRSDARSSAR